MLRRKREVFDDGYNYVMFHNNVEEAAEHLFFDCPSTICRGFALGIIRAEHLSIPQKLYHAKHAFGQPFFLEIFMIGAWYLWK
jgi:hypothetical protein